MFFCCCHQVPRRINSLQARRHYIKTNYQFRTPQNLFTKDILPKSFWINCNSNVDELGGWLGENNVIKLELDGKHHVVLGCLAAKQKGKICMNITRQTITPDHDFPPGERHYFIPYCYKIFELKPEYAVGDTGCFSDQGVMKIVLRCGYFEQEDAWHHAEDIDEILADPQYFPWTRQATVNPATGKVTIHPNKLKPVLIIRSDNAANYSPKNEKVQKTMYRLFKFS